MALKYAVLAIIVLVVLVGLYVRFAPVSVSAYHIEDVSAHLAAGRGGNFSVGDGGDIAAVQSPVALEALGPRLSDLIVNSTPRTTLLAGSLSEGDSDRQVATFVTRSALVGYPDITTVQLDRIEGGTQVLMNGKQVYGLEDFGVNEKRMRGWLEAIESGL